MQAVVFRNKGVIDKKSITTFGVSSKENPTAIGYFGTGLKYAIAILLRLGCGITIYSGASTYVFGSRREKIRVNEFDFITLNGRRIGWTTEVGKNWEMWMAMRELYCNCVDEHGDYFETRPGMVGPQEGHTLVVVTGDAFLDAWARRSEVFLTSEPIARHPQVHIHQGPSEYVYYRGVRAYTLTNPSLFTYNIQRRVDLTEDRTIKWQWDIDQVLKQGLMETNHPEVIRQTVTAGSKSHEGRVEFSGVLPSPEWLEVVGKLAATFEPGLNPTAMATARIWIMDRLKSATEADLNAVEVARLDRAASFCERIGYPVREYPIKVTEFLGEDCLGMAQNGCIYLARRALMMGTKMVAGTLVEEFIHLRFKHADETRSMQNFLIDAMMTLGEQLVGEPL